MDAEMYDDDEEDGDEMMDQHQNGQQAQQNDKKDNKAQAPRGTRLSDQLNMEDEPALVGYERYVSGGYSTQETQVGKISFCEPDLYPKPPLGSHIFSIYKSTERR
jgi:hypothetical protein